ncbi:hypothetical protein QYE76_048363 [Lolium multiflorum]|uniref:Uncharacterized protein n=1 Tax=Lolium multiflorum TaxID=4521 RepID=A0AAD8WFA5_LOLMU|nr:hypothetical protein QYE76_048363 [Lolium multiflorum]
MEPTNVKFYQLGNGGDLIFERDLGGLSEHLGRPHPEFHGVEVNDQHGGELQWIITADLRGKVEPPTSERILFSFRESSWMDGLARALQEALARTDAPPAEAPCGPSGLHVVQTQKELDNSRGYANQTHFALTQHGQAIRMLNKDRKSLRLQRAKKDATIVRLRAKIAALEITVKAQEDQLREIEDDDGGIDLQGGGAFLSDDDDFEEDEDPEEEDYEFLEAAEDGIIPIDVDVDVRPDETATTEKRQERFLNGLHDEMQTVLVNIPFADLEDLVDSAIQMEGKLNQANENRKRRLMHQSGPSNAPKYRPSSSGGFTPRNNSKPQMQTSRPGYQNRSGGNPRPGGHHNNNYNNNNNFNRAPPRAPNNNNNNNTNTVLHPRDQG